MRRRPIWLICLALPLLASCGARANPTKEPAARRTNTPPPVTFAAAGATPTRPEPTPTRKASPPPASPTLPPPQSLPTDPPTATSAFFVLSSPTAAGPGVTPIGPILASPGAPTTTALPHTGGPGGFETPTAVPMDLIPVTGGGGEEAAPTPDAAALLETRLREIDEQLTSGRLAYDPPERLAVGETTLLTVGLVPLLGQTAPEADATLAVELGAPVEDLEAVTISTSLFMEAELTGPAEAFRIRPLRANPRQVVAAGEVTEWAWEVTALRPGRHQLTLTISAVLDVGGETETRSKTYESDIEVAVDAAITGRYLVSRYWIPLLALGLVTGGSSVALTVRQLRFREQKRALMAALAASPPRHGQRFIFMSYSHRDERFAVPLARGLMDKGIHIWIDQKEIIAGEDWTEEMKVGLSQTDALLVVLSPRSMASRYVMQEVAAAQGSGKPVFPVMYKTVDLPPNLTNIHFVDFRQDVPSALETLAANLAQAGFKE
ncbi:MAG: toll/interleukin-1 receptor domain-containing protein [Chloroflexi bacterium]|nr:toll/interleukin-1 receptor domain-containing protein [Chloroflexota bacterium]